MSIMHDEARSRGSSAAALLILIGLVLVIAAVISFCQSSPSVSASGLRRAGGGRRHGRHLDGDAAWAAYDNLRPLTDAPNGNDTALFWHIPKSGGTTAKAICGCFNLTIASRAGALERFGHDKDEEIVAFSPWGDGGPRYVNVDTTSFDGMLRAEELGLVPSGAADIVFTTYPNFAVSHLFDGEHMGRALALFRHPVDRLVSTFYYLQVADWEATYAPEWAKLNVSNWAESVNRDNNSYVRRLAGKRGPQHATEEDLKLAMDVVREKFVVGLMTDMEESIRRFNVFLGVGESKERNSECMDKFFGEEELKKNSNTHPTVEEGSTAWNILAVANQLDMRLWNYVVQLYDEQKEIIDTHAFFKVEEQE